MSIESSLRGIRILSLDDNMLDNSILSELLSDTGIKLDCTTSVDAALRMIGDSHYDLILIDHMMPEMDGMAVLKHIRREHLCDDTPAVAVTGIAIASARESYLQAGFSGYVAKPIDRKLLLDTIGHVLGLYDRPEEQVLPNILVVDDDRMNLLIASKLLSGKYNVTTVNSGKAGFEFLEYNSCDLILLDLRMPEMDGFEFLKRIKADARLKDIPVVCLTADDEHDSEIKCFELGALDFISKPFVAEIMLSRVNRILELDHLRRQLKEEVEKQTRELQIHSRKLQRLTVQTMQTLAGTIDAKDKYTNGHSLRVAEYSRMIAARLNMPEMMQQDIYYIGLLHDIGKIGIPDEIINKTSKLTDEEYAVIKTHPSIGAEILESMSENPDIALGAKHHHERYDGRGYPEGLAGENIPLVARIIGVADAYDAMTSNRSYREVLPQAFVRKEIEKGSGTQFDPICAEIMLGIIDEDKQYNLKEHK